MAKGSKLFSFEVVVAASLQQFILQGQFGEAPQFIVVIFPGEAVYDVEGFLLSLVNTKSLEALTSLGQVVARKTTLHILHIAAQLGLSAYRSLVDGGKSIAFVPLGVPIRLWRFGQLIG